jgi:hypothetical protein
MNMEGTRGSSFRLHWEVQEMVKEKMRTNEG